MAAIITRVDDLHNTEEGLHVEAKVTRVLAVDGAEFEIDLTDENDAELMDFLRRYMLAGKALSSGTSKKKSISDHSLNGSPLKKARWFRAGMRAFADSRPDLGEASYLAPGGTYSYTDRLVKAYAQYVSVHGEFPVPE